MFKMPLHTMQIFLTIQTVAQGTALAINQAGLIDNLFTSDNEVWINQCPQISTKLIQLILT